MTETAADRPATAVPPGSVVLGERRVSQAQLAARAARLARALHERGIGEDDRVAVLLRNDLPFLEVALALNRLGAYCVPLNWHLTSPELASVLTDSGAGLVLCHRDLFPLLAPILEGRRLVCVPTPPELVAAYRIAEPAPAVPETAEAYDELLTAAPWEGPAPALRSNIIYTSGTTGAPKGVVREPASGEMVRRIREVMGLAYGLDGVTPVRTVITGPLYHSVPNVYALTALRTPGASVILQPRFDAEDLLRLIAAQAITHLHLVPTMFVRLLKLPEAVRRRYDLSSLRFVAHGAAPCPPEVKRRMIAWWGPVIHEYYGASETGPAVAHGSAEALAKPGTVGRPLPGAEVRILDPQGRPLPAGEIGEVYLRIAGYPRSHYLGNPQASAQIRRGELTTAGELGYLDADGYLFLTGRAKEMIVSGGVNIFPSEIENALHELPGVRDCAVFGIPDEDFGEVVCAHVEPEPGQALEAEALRAALAGKLARYKIPRRIVFDAALPREDSGKILKRRLQARYRPCPAA